MFLCYVLCVRFARCVSLFVSCLFFCFFGLMFLFVVNVFMRLFSPVLDGFTVVVCVRVFFFCFFWCGCSFAVCLLLVCLFV